MSLENKKSDKNEISKTLKQMKELVERLEWLKGCIKEHDRDTFLHFCSLWYDYERGETIQAKNT